MLIQCWNECSWDSMDKCFFVPDVPELKREDVPDVPEGEMQNGQDVLH